jgi:hypothetical protein
MNNNPDMVIPLGSKKLGNLSRNTPEINKLFLAILNAVQVVGAHKVTRRKQGVSYVCVSTLAKMPFCYYLSFIVQPTWSQVADLLFRPGAACELYKRLQKVYDFNSKIMSEMKARYERVSGPYSHSNSHNPLDHEDSGVSGHLGGIKTQQFAGEGERQQCLPIFGTKSSTPSSNFCCNKKSIKHHLQQGACVSQ